MKILILHNAYRQRGGEDAVAEAEAKLLRDAGHEVRLEIVSNSDLHGPVSKARAFINSRYDEIERDGYMI